MSISMNRVAPTRAALDELLSLLPDQVLLPGDPGWEVARDGWALPACYQPIAVVTVVDHEDVVTAVRWAARHGRSVSARPRGQAASAVDGTVLLRTRALRKIAIDPVARTARVGAGVTRSELLAATGEHGLTCLIGRSRDPSVVGSVMGGDPSWFGRAHGRAALSVNAFEIVDQTGTRRRVVRESDPDRFRTLCSGGDGTVVTAMDLALYPAPHLYGGRLLWTVEMARPVLCAFRDITRTAPDELTLRVQLLRFPVLPELPEEVRGGAFVSVDVAFLGSAPNAEELLAPLREIPATWLDTVASSSVAQLSDITAELLEQMPSSELSGRLRDLDDSAIDALLAVTGAGSGSPLIDVQILHLGGALARVSATDDPSGSIDEPYQVVCRGVPTSPESSADIHISLTQITIALQDRLTGYTLLDFPGTTDEQVLPHR